MTVSKNQCRCGDDTSITSLVGIQNLTSLTFLLIERHGVTDISPLSGLTSLTRLHLRDNAISDISALSGLTGVTELALSGNSITDIGALSGLTSLALLHLSGNLITDISALSGLTSLETLYLDGNRTSDRFHTSITDISALSGLTSLVFVDLTGTDVSCDDVNLLEAKGVEVSSACGDTDGGGGDCGCSQGPSLVAIQNLTGNGFPQPVETLGLYRPQAAGWTHKAGVPQAQRHHRT